MLPNAFVIGAMKSGTTSLCAMLNQHPKVFLSAIKEPDFFSRDEVFAKGIDWYKSQFASTNNHQVILEGSTSYTKHLQFPHAAERLAKQIPDARLIYILRHPIERIESHWQHEVLKNRTSLSVNQFARQHVEAIDISQYWKQLNVYRDLFPDEQIQILFQDDFRARPLEVLMRCCEFLRLHAHEFERSSTHANRSDDRRLDVLPIRLLRKYRWFDSRFEKLKQSVPTFIHPMAKLFLKSQKQPQREKLDSETIRWAESQIIDDSHRVLNYAGKSSGFWKFSTLMQQGTQLEPSTTDD